MDSEKAVIATKMENPAATTQVPRRKPRIVAVAGVLAAAYVLWCAAASAGSLIPEISKHRGHHHGHHGGKHGGDHGGQDAFLCTQVAALFPVLKSPGLDMMEKVLDSEKFMNLSISRLSGAVRIPTQSYDDLGEIGEDKRWDTMYDFAKYLKKTFPLVHQNLSLETINTHGLLYTWKGANQDLKPTLLMAHQVCGFSHFTNLILTFFKDVVPVAASTVDAWTHPPFSGHFDGEYIWGRGASDCKNSLTSIMESVEALIHAGFTPQRTLILSFGFDEEISGREGAGHLAPYLLKKYGKVNLYLKHFISCY